VAKNVNRRPCPSPPVAAARETAAVGCTARKLVPEICKLLKITSACWPYLQNAKGYRFTRAGFNRVHRRQIATHHASMAGFFAGTWLFRSPATP